jgi:hypothetical protein
VAKAARTEADLEGEGARLQGALAEELQAARARAASAGKPALAVVTPAPAIAPPGPDAPPPPPPKIPPMEGADTTHADATHLPLVQAMAEERDQQMRASHKGPTDVLRRVEVLWVRSNATHVVWCERRVPATQALASLTRDVILVAQIERGLVKERWNFG